MPTIPQVTQKGPAAPEVETFLAGPPADPKLRQIGEHVLTEVVASAVKVLAHEAAPPLPRGRLSSGPRLPEGTRDGRGGARARRLSAGLVPLEVRLPGGGRLQRPALALEQEGAAVHRPDVVRVELERAPPVRERALSVPQPRLRLPAHRGSAASSHVAADPWRHRPAGTQNPELCRTQTPGGRIRLLPGTQTVPAEKSSHVLLRTVVARCQELFGRQLF